MVAAADLYGDGNHGDAVFDGLSTVLGFTPNSEGVYTLDRDLQLETLTIGPGVAMRFENGCRIRVKGAFTTL